MIKRRTSWLAIAALTVASLALVACDNDGGGSRASSTSSVSSAPSTSTTSTLPRTASLWPPPGTGVLPASSSDALQGALDTWVAQGHLAGLTAAVATPDGVWSGAAGVDGAGTTLQADSALSIQSISKTFTAAEVMLLSSRGLIDLDAPVTDYIDVPFDTASATVRQVLGMRSGFPDHTTETAQVAMAADLDREWTATDVLATLVADSHRLGTVGGEPRYNNTNYLVLADLVAKVTGKTFAQAVRSDLLDPAGLQRTWVQPGETPAGPLTVGGKAAYADIVDEAGPLMPSRSFASFAIGSGSIASDAADVARWGYLLYGGHVIDSTLVEQMKSDPQPEPDMGPYGLGTMVSDYQGVTMLGHAGGGAESSYTAVLQVFAGDAPISITVLTPQGADFEEDIFPVFMQLYEIVAT